MARERRKEEEEDEEGRGRAAEEQQKKKKKEKKEGCDWRLPHLGHWPANVRVPLLSLPFPTRTPPERIETDLKTKPKKIERQKEKGGVAKRRKNKREENEAGS